MTVNFEAASEHFVERESSDLGTAQRLNFSPVVASRLLDALGSNDEFRALFLLNPRAALAQVGHTTPESDRDIKGRDPVLCCYGMKKLASKAEISAARESLHAALSTSVFHYDVTL